MFTATQARAFAMAECATMSRMPQGRVDTAPSSLSAMGGACGVTSAPAPGAGRRIARTIGQMFSSSCPANPRTALLARLLVVAAVASIASSAYLRSASRHATASTAAANSIVEGEAFVTVADDFEHRRHRVFTKVQREDGSIVRVSNVPHNNLPANGERVRWEVAPAGASGDVALVRMCHAEKSDTC